MIKKYLTRITFDGMVIYAEEVKANSKREAYDKAKTRLAKKLFKCSKLKNYSCEEMD